MSSFEETVVCPSYNKKKHQTCSRFTERIESSQTKLERCQMFEPLYLNSSRLQSKFVHDA